MKARKRKIAITTPKCTSVAAITGIEGLSLTEQAALAFIRDHAGCSNRALASKLGFSERGAEQMLARLREAGLVRQIGTGRGRRLELAFAVESHKECGKNEIANTLTKCGLPTGGLAKAPKHLHGGGHFLPQTAGVANVEKVPRRSAVEVFDAIRDLFDTFHKMVDEDYGGKMPAHMFDFWSSELTKLIDEAKPIFPPEAADYLAKVERDRDHMAALGYAGLHVEGPREFDRIVRLLKNATPQQLSAVYAGIQQRLLGPGDGPLLQLEAALVPDGS